MHPQGLGRQREVEVLQLLAEGLPADYAVFHGVEWSSVHDGVQWFGEIDAIVLCPNASLVLVEIKAGPVELTAEGLHKRYGDRVKDVAQQTRVQHAALRQRLKDEHLHVYVAQLLVLPDQDIAGGSVGYPRERIVDAGQMHALCERVIEAAPHAPHDAPKVARLMRFLDDVFALAPDVSAGVDWINRSTTRLYQGLATWVRRIGVPAGRIRIEATAGSGKTQLAHGLLLRAAEAGQRARYVCFNRPLALHLRQILPEQVEVATFHELATRLWRARPGEPDFGSPGVFPPMETLYTQTEHESEFDVMVIDELQDLDAAWVDALLRGLRPGGQAYLLGDEDQRLFDGRTCWTDPGCVTLSCPDNFRSPRNITAAVRAFGLASKRIEARCPLDGDVPGFHVWEDGDHAGLARTAEVIHGLLDEGIQPEQMAVLSLHGLDRSELLKTDEIAGLALRKFTGFDKQGNAQYSNGSLLADTAHRFKGQAAPVVVIGEMDFDAVSDLMRRRLFVGWTRAQWRLECVMSPRAEEALALRLGAT
nr:AAA family ATPase [Thiomonas sp. FB-Cd]